MRVAGNITAAAGFTVFIFAGCCIESPEPYNYIMLIMTLIGLIITYLGYRLEEITERICWNRLRKAKQRRKHRKVKMWLDRAQKNF